jgi:DNA-binding transcriptional MerR regulator
MSNNWTRLEVSKLAGITPSQLDYLTKIGLITPKRIGNKRPVVLYSWVQLVVIRVYAKLREEYSLQTLRNAIEYLNEHPEKLLINKRLVAYANEILWIDDTEIDFYKAVAVDGKNKGRMIATFTLQNLIDELVKVGKDNIVDFEDRYNYGSSQLE